MIKPARFEAQDVDALRALMPPRPDETWGKYMDRAIGAQLMTLGDAIFIAETYGCYALNKVVEPL